MKNIFLLTFVLLGFGQLVTNADSAGYNRTHKRMNFEKGPIGNISIIVDKSDYELSVYDEKGWYATYPVVFGNNSLADKKMQGDKNTPEGTFKIENKRVHEKWCRYLGLDFPTKESLVKFKEWKRKGEVPAKASIGGGIGIHGTWPHEDFVIDRYKNWTLGCVSMKNDDVTELYQFAGTGTTVTIRK